MASIRIKKQTSTVYGRNRQRLTPRFADRRMIRLIIFIQVMRSPFRLRLFVCRADDIHYPTDGRSLTENRPVKSAPVNGMVVTINTESQQNYISGRQLHLYSPSEIIRKTGSTLSFFYRVTSASWKVRHVHTQDVQAPSIGLAVKYSLSDFEVVIAFPLIAVIPSPVYGMRRKEVEFAETDSITAVSLSRL